MNVILKQMPTTECIVAKLKLSQYLWSFWNPLVSNGE